MVSKTEGKVGGVREVQNRPIFESIRTYIDTQYEKRNESQHPIREYENLCNAYAEMGGLKKIVSAIAAIEKRVMDMQLEKYERDEFIYYFNLIKGQ